MVLLVAAPYQTILPKYWHASERKLSRLFQAIYYFLQPLSVAYAILEHNRFRSEHIVKVIVVRCRCQWDRHQSVVTTGRALLFSLCTYCMAELGCMTFVAFICIGKLAACKFRVLRFRSLLDQKYWCGTGCTWNLPVRLWVQELLRLLFFAAPIRTQQ